MRDLGREMDDLFRGVASVALTGRTHPIDPETAETLRRLGYVR